MDEKEYKIRMLGLTGSYSFLRYLKQKGRARFGNILTEVPYGSLRLRRLDLLQLGLIKEGLEIKEGLKEEYYTLTSKGEKVIALLDEIIDVLKEEKP